jgi:small basic protein
MALLWVPLVHASRFSADDWFLAAAATVRTSLAMRPWLSWYALDTVDGNFRPLGTVVYLNHGFSVLGFYAGFLVCALAATLLYFIARKLGATGQLALCAALIFGSRDLLYGPVAWLCSLGDDLVLASGAGCVLLLLRSLHVAPRRAVLCHLGAFACLVVALLSKQSSYCIPLLALSTLTLRPGQERPASTQQQWAVALVTTTVYLATTVGVFHHASLLSRVGSTPYPIVFTADGLGYLLRSVLWFFGPFDLQIIPGFMTIETTLGFAILALLGWIGWRRRGRTGLGKRAMLFCVLAALVSIALFLFLPSRRVPYYADFAALWVAIPVAALCLGPESIAKGGRGLTMVVALVVLGGTSIQLKRTALIPSGTYLGGTYGMDAEKAESDAVRQQLRDHPHAETVVVRDNSPDSVYPAMICIWSREVRRVYVFRPRTNEWLVNSLDGRVPQDTPEIWTDVGAFHWTRPLPSAPTGEFLTLSERGSP